MRKSTVSFAVRSFWAAPERALRSNDAHLTVHEQIALNIGQRVAESGHAPKNLFASQAKEMLDSHPGIFMMTMFQKVSNASRAAFEAYQATQNGADASRVRSF